MISRGPYVGKYFIVFFIVVSSNLWELYFKEKKKTNYLDKAFVI